MFDFFINYIVKSIRAKTNFSNDECLNNYLII